MLPNVGLLEKTKEGGKEEKNDSHIEIHHIYVGTRPSEIY
jgi:hypothetical protein